MSGQVVAAEAISLQIEESLNGQSKIYYGRIKFANSIMIDKDRKKVSSVSVLRLSYRR